MITSRRDLLKIMGAVPLITRPVDAVAVPSEKSGSLRISNLVPGSRVWIADAATHAEIFLGKASAEGVVEAYPPESGQLLVRVRKVGYLSLQWGLYFNPRGGLDSYVVQQEDSAV